MTPACDRCPCPEICLGRRGWGDFCAWRAEPEPDPVKTLHIVNRSKLGPAPPPIVVDYGTDPGPGPNPPRRCCG